MKRLGLALALLSSFSANAAVYVVNATRTLTVSSATTAAQIAGVTQSANSAAGNEPTASTPGVPIAGVCGLRVIVSADSGRTLSGAGTIKFFYSDPMLARYAENKSVTLAVTATGRDQSSDFEVPVGFGLAYVEADTVTVSGGALTVRVETIACAR